MALSKNHRFGLISFVVLAALAVIVSTEPWSGRGLPVPGSLEASAPVISIEWKKLSDAWPSADRVDTILSYSAFDLAYNDASEQAAWVAYVLTRNEVEGAHISRTDNFREDTSIRSGSAKLADYKGSGFDRGHLAPAADMAWSKPGMSESFLLSNMSPQLAGFNRGVWKRLESQVRNWATEKDSILVISGPVFAEADTSIGVSQVGVPSYYFKVLVDLSPPDHSMIAFLLPHASSKAPLESFAITVDSLEIFTGYDFFATAPQQAAVNWMEEHLETENWTGP